MPSKQTKPVPIFRASWNNLSPDDGKINASRVISQGNKVLVDCTGGGRQAVVFVGDQVTTVYRRPSFACLPAFNSLLKFYDTQTELRAAHIGIKFMPLLDFGFLVTNFNRQTTKLDLRGTSIPAAALTEILRLVRLPSLRTLSIELNLVNSQTTAFLSFLKGHSNLQDLRITGTAQLSPEYSKVQADGRMKLEKLNILRVSSTAVADVVDAFDIPNLRVVHILTVGTGKDLAHQLTNLSSRWSKLPAASGTRTLVVQLGPEVLPNIGHHKSRDAGENENDGESPSLSKTRLSYLIRHLGSFKDSEVANDKQDEDDIHETSDDEKIKLAFPLHLILTPSPGRWKNKDCVSLRRWLESISCPARIGITLALAFEYTNQNTTKLKHRLSEGSGAKYDIDTAANRKMKDFFETFCKKETQEIPESGPTTSPISGIVFPAIKNTIPSAEISHQRRDPPPISEPCPTQSGAEETADPKEWRVDPVILRRFHLLWTAFAAKSKPKMEHTYSITRGFA